MYEIIVLHTFVVYLQRINRTEEQEMIVYYRIVWHKDGNCDIDYNGTR